MFDAGVESPLGGLLGSVRSVVAGVDVDGLDWADAARVVEECAEMEKRLAALRVAATATVRDKAFWRREGFRSAAHWMASKTGTAVGAAIASLEMAGLLADLPVVAEAFRTGVLSEAQAREIAGVAGDVPDAEERLVEAAGKLSLRGLQEECRRVEAAACVNEDERYRRVHRSRSYRTWVDRHGVGHVAPASLPTSWPG